MDVYIQKYRLQSNNLIPTTSSILQNELRNLITPVFQVHKYAPQFAKTVFAKVFVKSPAQIGVNNYCTKIHCRLVSRYLGDFKIAIRLYKPKWVGVGISFKYLCDYVNALMCANAKLLLVCTPSTSILLLKEL